MTIEPVIVRDLRIGEGRPAIIVPLTSTTTEALVADATALAGQPIDLVEWRIDHFAREIADPREHAAAVVEGAEALRTALAEHAGGVPVLVTFRTSSEGGEREISDEDFAQMIETVVGGGAADLVDVEMFREESAVRRAVAAASAAGVPVVGSNHHFDRTPDEEEIVERLRRMQELGASIPKIAVMPADAGDVLTLLKATWTMHSQHADRPIITMSMGPLGVVSRAAGGVFGSAATFGTVGAASAPGQIAVPELLAAMETLG